MQVDYRLTTKNSDLVDQIGEVGIDNENISRNRFVENQPYMPTDQIAKGL